VCPRKSQASLNEEPRGVGARTYLEPKEQQSVVLAQAQPVYLGSAHTEMEQLLKLRRVWGL
jgi:hypothetical protein